MKRVYALALLCIPLCLVLGFRAIQPSEGDGQQEQQQAQVPGYFIESDYYSMGEFGKFLELMGREIQQDGSFNLDGVTYPMGDYGWVELFVNPNGTVHFQARGGITEPPTRGPTYNAHMRAFRNWTPTGCAGVVAEMGETLGNTGVFVIDDHRVALEGTAQVTQRVFKAKRTRRPTPEEAFDYAFDIVFGAGEFPVPADEADVAQEMERGNLVEQAKQEVTGANAGRIARLFSSLSRDLRAGRVRVDDKDFEIGENFQFFITHMIATDGQSQRIRIALRNQGPQRQREQPTEPSFSDEVFEIPAREIAELLKRIGTEMLESGTITFDGVAYRAGVTGGYELGVQHGSLGIELNIRTLPPR